MSAAPPESAPKIHVADVRAARGASWIAEAFQLYRASPLVWTGLAVGWMVVTLGLFIVPLVGVVSAYLLQPVFFASFALAARKQQTGGRIEMADLFVGLRGNVRALVGVGSIELLAVVVVSLLFASLNVPTAMDSTGKMVPAEEMAAQLKGKEWYLLGGFGLVVMVKAALWFAPAVIAFHGVSTAHALRWSVYAALSNAGAIAVYGIVLTFVFIVALLPWGLGLVVALPLMAISTYSGYQDVFEKN